MTESTDWVSAIAILASGLILGLMFIYFVGRRRAAAASTTSDVDLELRDLEAKRDALIEQIRDLDDMGSKLGAAEAAEERTRLELATAGVLREIDGHKRVSMKPRKGAAAAASAATAVVAEPETPGVTSRNPATIGFLWGAASVAALALMGYLVVRYATPRQEGGSMTGNTPGEQTATTQQPQAPDAETKSLEAAVAQQPDNLGLRVELARVYLERENMMGVFDQTQYVLSKTPNEPRALTYQALVRLAMGQSKEAGEMLEQATKIAPSLLDSWVALAWVRTQEGNAKAADAAIAAAIKQHPEEKARLEEVLSQMRTRPSAPAQVAGGGGGSELPPGHPPITPDSPRVGPVTANSPAVAAPPPAAAASGQGVRITINAGPGAAGKKGTLFILARAAGVMAGPPVAVRRMPVTTLPVTIDLSAADSMMGQPLPPKMRLEARLDSDGDAFTKDPKDPQAVQDGVAPGTTISMSLQ